AIASFTLPKREEIESAAKRLYNSLTARNRAFVNETSEQKLLRVQKADEEFYEQARGLSHMILSPAATFLNNKRLLIVTERALQYIPFGALQDVGNSNQEMESSTSSRPLFPDYKPLLVHHEIVSLPSASVLGVLSHSASDTTSGQKTLAVLADPVFSEGDPRI